MVTLRGLTVLNFCCANYFVFSIDRLVVKVIGIGMARGIANRKLLTVLDGNGERGNLVDMTLKCDLSAVTSVNKVSSFRNRFVQIFD